MEKFIKAIVVTVIILVCGIVEAGAYEWDKKDMALQIAYTALHVVDWGQTRYIAKNPIQYGYQENVFEDGRVVPVNTQKVNRDTNFILGKNPSKGQVDVYFASTLVAHTLISHYLPDAIKALGGSDKMAKNARTIWQCVSISFEGGVVARNINVQGGFKFAF